MAIPLPRPTAQARALATRSSILRAAHSLLLEHGSAQLTIRGVSELCGFKAPTIYHHFGDKTGLVDAVLDETFAELLTQLRAVPRPANPLHFVRELGRAFLEFCLENPRHYALLSAPRFESDDLLPSAEAGRAIVYGALADAASAGLLRQGELETTFQAMWATLNGLVALRISRPKYPWAPDLVDCALELVIRGIACDAERET